MGAAISSRRRPPGPDLRAATVAAAPRHCAREKHRFGAGTRGGQRAASCFGYAAAMNRTVLIAWIAAAVAAVAAIIDIIVKPVHWERSLALAVLVAVVAAGIALVQTRRVTAR